MILSIVALLVGIIIGYVASPTEVEVKPRRNWKIWVEPTEDPSVYKGVYERDGSRSYVVTGRGVSSTLKSLAEEIDNE